MFYRKDLDKKQRFLVDYIKSTLRCLVCVYMGFGKTVCALTAALDLLREGKVRKIIIVAPLLVARDTWPDEIMNWLHLRGIKFSVMVGDPDQRMRALRKNVPIYIINRENLPWLWQVTEKGKTWKFDMLIYDESSRLKSGKKRTAKKKNEDGTKSGGNISEFGVLAAARQMHINRVVLLSGTPSPGGYENLWGQAYVCDLGVRLGDTRKRFLDKYFDSDYMGWKHTLKEGSGEKITRKLSDIMISFKDPNKNPSKLYPRYVKLTDKHMKEYKKFNKTLVSELYDVEAMSAGVLTNKLLQFANGSLYRNHEDGSREVVPIHDRKLAELESIIEESGDANILLAYSFKFDRDRIKKRFPKAVVFEDDPKAMRKWNKGKIKLLLAHPASMGHGLNFQQGGFIQVWYGLPWSLELFQQFNKRLARRGQTQTVRIYVIMAKGTNDEVVWEVLGDKAATQDDITDAVRVHVKEMAA